MKSILIAGFKGNNNSAKHLLDKIDFKNKLYLENDFEISVKQLENELTNKYDYIIVFGQKPIIKSIYIELKGVNENEEFITNYNYSKLIEFLNKNNYKTVISNNAGNYLCNNIYFNGLKYININNLKTKIIFIHIPYLKNIPNIDNLAQSFTQYINL